MERGLELNRDLRKASSYVLSLLPAPIEMGRVLANWRFLPSAQLGGDAFGYDWLDPDTFACYLIDVSGHGVGAAMHSVTVMNVLRQRALPGVDFTDPAAVLTSLNDKFQMDRHDGLYFTMWYGVYRTSERMMAYSAAGHHPASLVTADKQTVYPLGEPNLMIGAIPGVAYDVSRAAVPAGSTLFLFSDGAFEVVTADGSRWSRSDFLPLLQEPGDSDMPEPERIYRRVRSVMGTGVMEDDFSIVAVTFP